MYYIRKLPPKQQLFQPICQQKSKHFIIKLYNCNKYVLYFTIDNVTNMYYNII